MNNGPEIVDIVNEADEVVGNATKDEAHHKKLPHRVVAVYLFDGQGRLLLQEHLKWNGALDHSIGGHVKAGEAYEEAAAREAEEELGVELNLKELATFPTKDGFNHMFRVYEAQIPPGWVFSPSDEVQRLEPIMPEEVSRLMVERPDKFTQGFRCTFLRYQEAKS